MPHSLFLSPPSLTLAMGNLLYIIAVILVIIWAVSYFGGYYTGGIIHTLLVIAIIAILLRVISGRSAV
jgi:predicted ferric reductase